jgi:6-phosphogluconolactonase
MFTVDAITGKLTSTGTADVGSGPVSVAITPSGQFAYVANFGSSNVSPFAIDARNGALRPVDIATSTGTNPLSVTVDPSGQFVYVANFGSNDVSAFALDGNLGTLTALAGPVPSGTNPAGVILAGQTN